MPFRPDAFHRAARALIPLAALALFAAPVHAGTPTSGLIYIAEYAGAHGVWEFPFTWDGSSQFITGTPRLITNLPTAAGCEVVDGGAAIIIAGQGDYCGNCAYKVDIATGATQTITAGNNNNTVSLVPGSSLAYLGWYDTSLALVSTTPFAPISVNTITGDDTAVTQLAITPSHGAFYTSGAFGPASFGRIDLSTYTTSRIFTAFPATGILYDSFSASLIISQGNRLTQVDPANPSVILSGYTLPARAVLGLSRSGAGHFIGTDGDTFILVDYSESALIGDASTKFAISTTPVLFMSGQPSVIYGPGACAADLTGDGFVDFSDYLEFLNLYDASDLRVDFNGDGTVDFSDYLEFLNHYDAGC